MQRFIHTVSGYVLYIQPAYIHIYLTVKCDMYSIHVITHFVFWNIKISFSAPVTRQAIGSIILLINFEFNYCLHLSIINSFFKSILNQQKYNYFVYITICLHRLTINLAPLSCRANKHRAWGVQPSPCNASSIWGISTMDFHPSYTGAGPSPAYL